MEKIRVLLADDHQLIIDGISAILKNESDFELIGSFNNGQDALENINGLSPDIAIVDIEMPELSGIEILEIISKSSNTKIIILSAYEELSLIKRCLSLGAKGYLLKRSNPNEIIDAVKRVAEGGSYFSQEVTEKYINDSTTISESKESKVKGIEILTERELEVLKLIVDGNSNPQIAEQLYISKRTVDTHRVNLMQKLDIHSTVELVKFAIKHNL